MKEILKQKGPLSWFAANHVAANLLMILIIAGGIISLLSVTIEIFPDTSVDIITVQVEYLGASPEEVEEGVVVRVEEAVAGIEGIKRLTSTSLENWGTVVIEVEEGYDPKEVLDDVEAEVNRITTFPGETEKPIISEVTTRRQVVNIAIYGNVSEKTLKALAERMRDDLTAKDIISQVEISGAREYEISIEVSEEALRKYNLSFDDVSRAVARSSLDLPGGYVKTRGGEILIRTKGQRYTGREYEQIVVVTAPDGTDIRLGDIATVIDGFEDSDLISRYDAMPSTGLMVYRIGDQNLLELTDEVMDYLEYQRRVLPEGVHISTWFDRSELLKSRLHLLQKNAILGLIFVFLILSLFLDLRLAFWTTLGIPISFMGAFWLMPVMDVSINMISLFGFILALGIVVDDAIVVGENVYSYMQEGYKPIQAAILGVREMAAPVTMAVLTTMFAFTPLLFLYGVWGKFIGVIPKIVISILAFSLVEALLILPAHLSGSNRSVVGRPLFRPLGFVRTRIQNGLKYFVENIFAPFVQRCVKWRYITLAVGVFVLMLAVGVLKAGFIQFLFMPKVDADNVWAALSMPQGTTIDQTVKVVERIEAAAVRVQQRIDEQRPEGAASIVKHVSTTIGEQPFTRNAGAGPPRDSGTGSNVAEVNIELLAGEKRGKEYPSAMIANMWREEVGEVPGISSLTFQSSFFSVGEAINIELTHQNFDKLLAAVEDFKAALKNYTGVTDIKDSFEPGKLEIKLELTDLGRSMGLTLADLARQVRQGFYGDEVQRIQRGRNDIRVMVRYPEKRRTSIGDIEDMRIRLNDGTEVPFKTVADVRMGRGYAAIDRSNRRRVVSVTADVEESEANANEINAELFATVLPELQSRYPGLSYDIEGEQKEQKEVQKSLLSSASVALMAIFALLAIQFRSYIQPVIIMSAIPFGLVGALIGHLVMGYNLTMLSIFGIVALTGIVVNDSLIMIDLINRERQDKALKLPRIIRDSVTRRFRPILLTTLTTFCGLVPMMLEKSLQARFLIPMAVSLAFGVLFATMITLILVPSLYMIIEDIKKLFGIKQAVFDTEVIIDPDSAPDTKPEEI